MQFQTLVNQERLYSIVHCTRGQLSTTFAAAAAFCMTEFDRRFIKEGKE